MEEQTTNQDLNQQASNMFARITGIITKPAEEWLKIKAEQADAKKIILTYVLPLTLIAGLCTILGYGLIGKSVSIPFLGSITQKGWGLGLNYGLISIISSVIAVFVSALVIDLLAPSFKSEKNFGRSTQLVAYAMTPMWIGGILSIIPSVAWVGSLVGLYGIYLMYLGLEPIKSTPKEQTIAYFIVSILVIVVSYFILSLIIGAILAIFFLGSAGGLI
ncbi:MAG: hypothetical protein CVU05_06405 [Bacteroidetes bacterium HGW-Bacteroidetes-21]|jgi:hypothetical protein|nr:MAG: hypothetical protein CVU05_06405 [Bacteroidetes bacterium HGW-Bacteroidetes-21]